MNWKVLTGLALMLAPVWPNVGLVDAVFIWTGGLLLLLGLQAATPAPTWKEKP